MMGSLAVAGSFVCVRFAPAVARALGRSDPGEVVADEVAGQAVTYMVVSFMAVGQGWTAGLAGFVLFRVFDVFKPWPVKQAEDLPEGWGIVADDLLAGLYAAGALAVCVQTGVVGYVEQWLRGEDSGLSVGPAFVLGAVQGLTEFLPVSSSGHLVLFERLFGYDPEQPSMLLFDLAAHLGTVAAILVVFRRSIGAFFRNLAGSNRYGDGAAAIYRTSPSVHFLVLAVIATGVTAVVGLVLKGYFTAARGNLALVVWMWVITGTLLLLTDRRKRARVGLRQFGFTAAVVVGLAQAAAILPGISRSGATICAAILIGLHRRWAVEFSFLIAIPAIIGAALIESLEQLGTIGSSGPGVISMIVAAATAAVVGVGALKVLIRSSRRGKLKYFAVYCYILAMLVGVYLLSAG